MTLMLGAIGALLDIIQSFLWGNTFHTYYITADLWAQALPRTERRDLCMSIWNFHGQPICAQSRYLSKTWQQSRTIPLLAQVHITTATQAVENHLVERVYTFWVSDQAQQLNSYSFQLSDKTKYSAASSKNSCPSQAMARLAVSNSVVLDNVIS